MKYSFEAWLEQCKNGKMIQRAVDNVQFEHFNYKGKRHLGT